MNEIKMFAVHMPRRDALIPALADTLYSGYLAEGPRVKEFEEALASVVQTRRVVAVNSCTSAITLALRAAGVKDGDEVITTAMTCTATNLPILMAGARPVFADVDPVTGLIDSEDVERLFYRRRPKAMICVDWGGMPCDLNALLAITEKHRVPLIEDAAHSLGATYHGRAVGSVADMTCFSFQAIKHITTGDGGALTFNGKSETEGMYNLVRRLRWYGIDRDSPVEDTRIGIDIVDAGYKFNMNDLAAILGLAQLPYLQKIVSAQRVNANVYSTMLPLEFGRNFDAPDIRSAWWLYTVLLPEPGMQQKFRMFMKERGIQVSQVHKRNDEYTVFRPFGRQMMGLNRFSSRMMCLPVHWALTPGDLERVVAACEEWGRAGA